MDNIIDKEISKLVSSEQLKHLYTNMKDVIYPAPPKFHILVTHYRTPQYLEKCLNSIFTQKTSIPIHAHLVDDNSQMLEVTHILEKWKLKEPLRLSITVQNERLEKGRNLFHILKTAKINQEDIIGILDGDDWLACEDAIQRVIDEYISTGCWVTYGSYKHSDNTPGCCTTPLTPLHLISESMGRGFRNAPWVFSHFFTAKAFLWFKVKEDILMFDGLTKSAGLPVDQLFNIPIAEMAGSTNISYIPNILCIYNNESSQNTYKSHISVQEEYDRKNREREAYKSIERPLGDYTVLIPCKGRLNLLKTTLERFNDEKRDDKIISIFLVEHSENPEFKSLAKEYKCGWLYIPLTGNIDTPNGQFNRALTFDIGVIYSYPSKYYLCHDNDLLVPVDFWNKLEINIKRENYEVLQTYSDRFVWQTNKPLSEYIMNDLKWFKEEFNEERDCSKNAPGAKGGSITISREAYLKVGGHDPHFFFGYGPEDSFFWRKIQLFYNIGYADEPRIPLTHLWHPCAANDNPYKNIMDYFFYNLAKLSDNDLRKYIEYKANIFRNFIK